MTIAERCWKGLEGVRDFPTFRDYLIDTLNWELDPDVREMEETAFEYTHEELSSPLLDDKCDGRALQLRFLEEVPWGVFLLDFKCEDPFTKSKGFTTVLRQILNNLVPKRRKDPSLKSWDRENLLFICTYGYEHFRFAYFKAPNGKESVSPLAVFGWNQGDTAIRTLCEHNLPLLEWERMDHWAEAFDVEAVTKKFFGEYRRIFESVEKRIEGVPKGEGRRLFTQRLFNRLMFIQFIQKKGWLQFPVVQSDVAQTLQSVPLGKSQVREPVLHRTQVGEPVLHRTQVGESVLHRTQVGEPVLHRTQVGEPVPQGYLQALYNDAVAKGENFLHDRLYYLFFEALNNPHNADDPERLEMLKDKCGKTVFLNGGLFSDLEDDYDRKDFVKIPNEAFADILDLFGRYNFTITESTPLNIEVAVDPEMLGKVFEELVTGRHESGSYYTPRPVVSFMCRESLKAYLGTQLPKEKPEALERFVEQRDPKGLKNLKELSIALERVRVCDPACGSGAYLLGMLHELFDLVECVYKEHEEDPPTDYERKLNIIQNNLYGVDIDPFAVNIAMLRLWLSLAVEYEGEAPPPLPNLDFKIETGDSLTAHDPFKDMDLIKERFDELAGELATLKSEYLRSLGEAKRTVREKIERKEDEIAELLHAHEEPGVLDWWVKFADVFADGGFDIVIANPPYLRQELLGKDYKAKRLKPVFPEVYSGTADIYVYFYARTHQILRKDGVGCFISSNKWLRAGYGEKLRQHLLDSQAFRLVADFGDLPVFQSATAYPCIFLWQKQPRDKATTEWAVIGNLEECYREGIRNCVSRIGIQVPASQFGKGKPRLASPKDADRRQKMEKSGPPLGEYVDGKIFYGVKTGLNEAFIIDRETRDRLITQDPKSAEILKPLIAGDDVRKYEIQFREKYLIWTYIGVPIDNYPAVFEHLKRFKAKAEKRWDKGNHWWELRACDYYDAFEQPKIIYPDIGKELRFAIDLDGHYSVNTTYLIPQGDYYLLGVLNSETTFIYLTETNAQIRGGYLRFFGQYLETLPIPDASSADRKTVGKLAEKAQGLHGKRRERVERFLLDLGIDPADSNSRNPLEQPWELTVEEASSRLKRLKNTRQDAASTFKEAKDETIALTEQIATVEEEIDERVQALYGL